MKIAIVSALLLFATSSFAASPCKSATETKKLDQTSTQNTQKRVNLGGDPWRLDPKEVAARQIESMDASLKAATVKGSLTQVKADERTQVLSYKAADRTYEVTMKKPEWLLPYSGIYKTMMWNVTSVKTTCDASAAKPASKKANK